MCIPFFFQFQIFLQPRHENVAAFFLPWARPEQYKFVDFFRHDFEKITRGLIYSKGAVRDADRSKFISVCLDGDMGDLALFGLFAFGLNPNDRKADCAELRSIMSSTLTLDRGIVFINLRHIYMDMISSIDMRIRKVNIEVYLMFPRCPVVIMKIAEIWNQEMSTALVQEGQGFGGRA